VPYAASLLLVEFSRTESAWQARLVERGSLRHVDPLGDAGKHSFEVVRATVAHLLMNGMAHEVVLFG